MSNLPRIISAPTIERGRRCENCRHFNRGELAIQQYKAKRHEDLNKVAKKVLEGGPVPAGLQGKRLGDMEKVTKIAGRDAQTRNFSDLDARMQALGVNYELGDTMMRQGVLGMCLIGVPEGDFVHKDYFCGTKYDPAVKVDGAEKHDETAEEARNRLGLDD